MVRARHEVKHRSCRPAPRLVLGSGVERVAAVDFGMARVGVAVSDELGLLAHPRPHISAARGHGEVIERLVEMAQREGVQRLLVGWPRRLNGERGPAARRVERFAQQLAERCQLEVTLCDEWLTTREASRRLSASGLSQRQARPRVDSAAAAVLLQGFLDARRNGSDAP